MLSESFELTLPDAVRNHSVQDEDYVAQDKYTQKSQNTRSDLVKFLLVLEDSHALLDEQTGQEHEHLATNFDNLLLSAYEPLVE